MTQRRGSDAVICNQRQTTNATTGRDHRRMVDRVADYKLQLTPDGRTTPRHLAENGRCGSHSNRTIKIRRLQGRQQFGEQRIRQGEGAVAVAFDIARPGTFVIVNAFSGQAFGQRHIMVQTVPNVLTDGGAGKFWHRLAIGSRIQQSNVLCNGRKRSTRCTD